MTTFIFLHLQIGPTGMGTMDPVTGRYCPRQVPRSTSSDTNRRNYCKYSKIYWLFFTSNPKNFKFDSMIMKLKLHNTFYPNAFAS